jgi:hypothetical protein
MTFTLDELESLLRQKEMVPRAEHFPSPVYSNFVNGLLQNQDPLNRELFSQDSVSRSSSTQHLTLADLQHAIPEHHSDPSLPTTLRMSPTHVDMCSNTN